MEPGTAEVEASVRPKFSAALMRRLSGLLYVIVFGSLLLDHHTNHSSADIALWFFFCLSVISTILAFSSGQLILWTLGKIGYIEITDPAFQQRIRTRYESDIDQLTRLGFRPLFFEGETTSVFRLFLIFPAIVKLMLLRRRAVIAVQGGTKFVNGCPILSDGDKSTFACAGSLGVKFRTAFKDGTILETKAYGDAGIKTGPKLVKHCFKGESIGYVWDQHKKWIQLLETDSNPIVRDFSFQAWVQIIRVVNADLRSNN